jgi:hypothetical protein
MMEKKFLQKKQKLMKLCFFSCKSTTNGGIGHNHVEKTLPQPQQQPNKPQTTTQPKNKRPKNNYHRTCACKTPTTYNQIKNKEKGELAQNKSIHFPAKSNAFSSIKTRKVFQIHRNHQHRLNLHSKMPPLLRIPVF